MTTMADLALPGSDADEADEDRAMVLKATRLTAFFDAVVCTYRKLCEVVFAGVRERFLFAQFPCRTVVHYYSTRMSPFSLNIVWYWDVVESWAEATTVVHLRSEPRSQEFELLAANQRSLCARVGGRFLEFSVHHTSDSGMWSAWEPLVTHAVYGLLLDDINRLIKMVPDRHR